MERMKIQDNSGDKKYFTIIPNYIYNHSTLWDREVYCQMKRIAGDNGKCWISQKNLAKQCGISINRLKKSIKYLLEHNWIKEIGKKQSNKNDTEGTKIYEICDLWKMNNEFYEKQKAVSRDDTTMTKAVSRDDKGGITNEQKAVSPDAYKEEPIKNNKEEYLAAEAAKDNSSSSQTEKKPNQLWQLMEWAEKQRGSPFVNRGKQLKYLKHLKDANIAITRIKDRWREMEEDNFWSEKGFDFKNLADNFDRKN